MLDSTLCKYDVCLCLQERQKQLESLGISLQSSGIKVGDDKSFLVNLNADPALNELLVYYLKVRTPVLRYALFNSLLFTFPVKTRPSLIHLAFKHCHNSAAIEINLICTLLESLKVILYLHKLIRSVLTSDGQ